jgi:hypothetical protein
MVWFKGLKYITMGDNNAHISKPESHSFRPLSGLINATANLYVKNL